MRIKPITSIDRLLRHDFAYLPVRPVMLFDRPSRWQRLARTILKTVLALLVVCALSASATPDYVSSLLSLEGSSYSAANCSGLITKAKRHGPCSALQIWDGCSGDLVVIREVTSLAMVDKAQLRVGDVVDFAGVHVAAYIGGGYFIDSVPERGVAKFQTVNPHDLWYSGKVRILRWRNS